MSISRDANNVSLGTHSQTVMQLTTSLNILNQKIAIKKNDILNFENTMKSLRESLTQMTTLLKSIANNKEESAQAITQTNAYSQEMIKNKNLLRDAKQELAGMCAQASQLQTQIAAVQETEQAEQKRQEELMQAILLAESLIKTPTEEDNIPSVEIAATQMSDATHAETEAAAENPTIVDVVNANSDKGEPNFSDSEIELTSVASKNLPSSLEYERTAISHYNMHQVASSVSNMRRSLRKAIANEANVEDIRKLESKFAEIMDIYSTKSRELLHTLRTLNSLYIVLQLFIELTKKSEISAAERTISQQHILFLKDKFKNLLTTQMQSWTDANSFTFLFFMNAAEFLVCQMQGTENTKNYLNELLMLLNNSTWLSNINKIYLEYVIEASIGIASSLEESPLTEYSRRIYSALEALNANNDNDENADDIEELADTNEEVAGQFNDIVASLLFLQSPSESAQLAAVAIEPESQTNIAVLPKISSTDTATSSAANDYDNMPALEPIPTAVITKKSTIVGFVPSQYRYEENGIFSNKFVDNQLKHIRYVLCNKTLSLDEINNLFIALEISLKQYFEKNPRNIKPDVRAKEAISEFIQSIFFYMMANKKYLKVDATLSFDALIKQPLLWYVSTYNSQRPKLCLYVRNDGNFLNVLAMNNYPKQFCQAFISLISIFGNTDNPALQEFLTRKGGRFDETLLSITARVNSFEMLNTLLPIIKVALPADAFKQYINQYTSAKKTALDYALEHSYRGDSDKICQLLLAEGAKIYTALEKPQSTDASNNNNKRSHSAIESDSTNAAPRAKRPIVTFPRHASSAFSPVRQTTPVTHIVNPVSILKKDQQRMNPLQKHVWFSDTYSSMDENGVITEAHSSFASYMKARSLPKDAKKILSNEQTLTPSPVIQDSNAPAQPRTPSPAFFTNRVPTHAHSLAARVQSPAIETFHLGHGAFTELNLKAPSAPVTSVIALAVENVILANGNLINPADLVNFLTSLPTGTLVALLPNKAYSFPESENQGPGTMNQLVSELQSHTTLPLPIASIYMMKDGQEIFRHKNAVLNHICTKYKLEQNNIAYVDMPGAHLDRALSAGFTGITVEPGENLLRAVENWLTRPSLRANYS